MTTAVDENWKIETLFQKAFKRTKERFLSYFLAMLAMWGASFGITFLVVLVGGVSWGLSSLAHSDALMGLLMVICVIAAAVLLLYIVGWWGLAMIKIMIQDSKTDLSSAFKSVRPLVWKYVGTQAIVGLFLIGLIPFMVLSVGVVGILWSLWGMFMGFVFLEKDKRGMDAIWYSRAIMNQKFWPTVGRIAFLSVIFMGLQLILSLSHDGTLRALSALVSLFGTPFVISFNYELYKQLDHGVEVTRPKVWIVLSVVGWLIALVSVPAIIYFASTTAPNLFKDKRFNQYNDKKQFRYDLSPTRASSI